MTGSFENKRRYARVVLGLDSPISTDVISESECVRGSMTVLSLGGGCIEMCPTFRVDTPVQLRFTLPGPEHDITCGGMVRYEDPGHGIGIEFTQLSPEDRELIREAVTAWLAKERSLAAQ